MATLSTKSSYRILALVLLLILAACAPEDLDITPTPTNTPPPTATPTPTAVPENFIDPELANEEALNTILAALPARIPAGAIEWVRDYSRGTDSIETLPNVKNGVSSRVFFNEQTGGQMNLSFGVFDSPDDAAARYEFIKGIRQPLETGNSNPEFPSPNIFGAGLYGSVAIFQIDNYFIEVNIELFSSTQGNPLVPLSRATLNFFNGVRADADAAKEAASQGIDSSASAATEEPAAQAESITGDAVLDAILAVVPGEITGDAIWKRDYSRGENNGVDIPARGFTNGTAAQIYYDTQSSGNMRITFGHFDTADDALAQYERFKGIRAGLEEENNHVEDGFPTPHSFGSGLYGSVALFQLDDVFVEVLIERAPGTIANPLESISRRMLNAVDEARASLG